MGLDGRVISNLGVLAAIVESGSFSRAADMLGVSPSGISRSMAKLETRIGVRLLDRNTRSVSLTDEGRRFFEQVSPLLDNLENAVAQTAGAAHAVRGRLRVNIDTFAARAVVAPHVRSFLDLHPELSLELVVKDQLGDLVGDGFDLALRFGTPPDSSWIARKLLLTHSATVASPAYLAAAGMPEHPQDLAGHDCIMVRNGASGQLMQAWTYQRRGKTVSVDVKGRLIVNESSTLLQTCLSGAGVARIKAASVREHIDSGALVELFPEWRGENYPLYAIYPSRHLVAAKLRAFLDFIAARIAEQP